MGACQYLENLVAQIDSPQLDQMYISYSNQPGDVPVAQLSKFVNRSVGPRLTLFRHARVCFFGLFISFTTHHHTDPSNWLWRLNSTKTVITFEGVQWRFSDIVQALGRFSVAATLSNVVHLKLEAKPRGSLNNFHQLLVEDMGDAEWLRLLHPFSSVQTLHVSQRLAGYVALALEDIAEEMVTEVLPSLDLIYLEDQQASSIDKFVAARRLSGHPVTVVDTKTEFYERISSFVSD